MFCEWYVYYLGIDVVFESVVVNLCGCLYKIVVDVVFDEGV